MSEIKRIVVSPELLLSFYSYRLGFEPRPDRRVLLYLSFSHLSRADLIVSCQL